MFVHGGFPKLKQGILDVLEVEGAPTVEKLATKAKLWETAAELEAAMQNRGLAGTVCRTPREWRSHPQGQAVLKEPIIHLEEDDSGSVTPATPRLLSTGTCVTRPLSDVLILDFSHVIASPVVGRSLVDHGATVMKIVTKSRPRRHLFDEEANHGKITVEVDLETTEGNEATSALSFSSPSSCSANVKNHRMTFSSMKHVLPRLTH